MNESAPIIPQDPKFQEVRGKPPAEEKKESESVSDSLAQLSATYAQSTRSLQSVQGEVKEEYEEEDALISALFDRCVLENDELEDELIESNLIEEYDKYFKDADLIVVRDGYKKNALKGIPNAITKAELYQMLEIIKYNNKIFQVSLRGMPPGFYASFLRDVATLLTRKSGRELIQKIDELVKKTGKPIEISFHKSAGARAGDVRYNPQSICVLPGIKENRKELYEQPSFIGLGHELIHVLHAQTTDIHHPEPPTLGKEFSDLEEQVTITGLKNRIAPQTTQSDDAMSDDAYFDDFDKEDSDNYELLNENRLLAEFDLPLRTSHRGITKVLDYDGKNLQEWGDYFNFIVSFGSKQLIEEFVVKNRDNLRIKFGEMTLLETVIKELIINGDGSVEGLKHLFNLDLHIDFAKPFRNLHGMSLLHLICREGRVEILKFVLDNYKHIDVNVEDRKGLTPLDIAERNHRQNIIDILNNAISLRAKEAVSSTSSTGDVEEVESFISDQQIINELIHLLFNEQGLEVFLRKYKDRIMTIDYQGEALANHIRFIAMDSGKSDLLDLFDKYI